MRRLTIYLLLLSPLVSLAAQTGADEWKAFTPKIGGFEVMFPGTPLEQKQIVKTPAGDIIMTVFALELKKGAGSFVVGVSELPPEMVKAGTEDQRLENARKGAIDALNNTLEKGKGKVKPRLEKKVDLPGTRYPGWDLHLEVTPKQHVRTKLYAVQNRLYQLAAVGSSEFVNSKDSLKFLDSLKLTK
jgi:hypothetical protein